MLKLQYESRFFALCSLALVALLGAASCKDDEGSGKKTGGSQSSGDGGKDSGAEPEGGTQAMETAGSGGAAGAEAGTGGAAAGSGGEAGESQAAGAVGAAGKAGEPAGEAGKAGGGKAGAGGKLGGGGEGGRATRAGAGGAAGASAGRGGASGSGGEGGAAGGGGEGGAGRGGAGGHSGGAGAAGGGGEGGEGGVSGGGGGGAGEAGAAGGGGAGGASGGGGAPGEGRCGTRGGIGCTADEFCDFPPEAECGANDRGGVCAERSDFCPAIYAPVCGCNNRTYASECTAHSAGVSVKHDLLCTVDECEAAGGHPVYGTGPSIPMCEPGEQSWSVSGGTENVVCCAPREPGASCGVDLSCEPDEFCNYEVSAGGQGCDGSVRNPKGVCEPTPPAFMPEFNPVCGCNHRSYSNASEAHFYGNAVLHESACTELDCAAVAGRVVYGTGPAPTCARGEELYTFVVTGSGAMAIEGAICCVQSM